MFSVIHDTLDIYEYTGTDSVKLYAVIRRCTRNQCGHKQIRPKGRENDRQRLPYYLLLVYENMSKNLYFSALTRDRPSFADAKVQTLYNMTKYFYKKIEELQKRTAKTPMEKNIYYINYYARKE